MMKRTLNLHEIQDLSTQILRTVNDICLKNDLRYYLVCGSVLGAIRHGGPIPWDYDTDITVPLPEMERFCTIMVKELKDTPYQIYVPGETDDINSVAAFPRIGLKNVNPRKIHIDVFYQIGISSNEEEQITHTAELKKLKDIYKNIRLSNTGNGGIFKVLAKRTYLKIKTYKYDEKEVLNEFKKLCYKYPYENSEYVTNPCGSYGLKNIVPKKYFGIPRLVPYMDMMLPVPELTEEYLVHYYKDFQKYPPQDEIDRMMAYSVEIEEETGNGEKI